MRILLVLAMLFSSIGTPVVAAAHGASPANLFAIAELHSDAVLDDETHSPADVAGGHHHHYCGHIIVVPDIALGELARPRAGTQRPALTATLGSYNQAPPTEPPSA